ncbi:MAG: vanadium-dependent haloperoxidase [Paracoccaceae bacterium]
MDRRGFTALALGAGFGLTGLAGRATPAAGLDARAVADNWYRLILELVRHTPTYSPPVASRAFAYLGVTAYEAIASGRPEMAPLAGQLAGLSPAPVREAGAGHDEGIVLQAALKASVAAFFGNTGPTGQHAISRMSEVMDGKAAEGVAPDVAARSAAHGQAVAAHVLAWSAGDGGATVGNLGFPMTWTLSDAPGAWKPTSLIRLQQAPLLPLWGGNRPFAMPSAEACDLPLPPAYSEDPSSAFYAEAKEVLDVSRALTEEQKAIARFWSDDPMLSSTPPGHWVAITRGALAGRGAGIAEGVEVMMRVSVAVADAFIASWRIKYRDNLLRPVTYIRATMDKGFTPLLNTPPFPEYPSGHSAQSGAAAAVLTAHFGDGFAFTDDSHADDGLPARSFPSFEAAAGEAALSRLYGGIHFRSGIDQGLVLGRCVGAHSVALKTEA